MVGFTYKVYPEHSRIEVHVLKFKHPHIIVCFGGHFFDCISLLKRKETAALSDPYLTMYLVFDQELVFHSSVYLAATPASGCV